MGHLLGIPTLFKKEKFDEMKKELNRAQAKDRKTERQSETAADQLRGLLAGEEEYNTIVASELVPKLREWIPWLRDAFDTRVIRRTLDSVDYENRPIFGMRPYCEHILLMELRDSEKEILAKLTNQMVEDTPLTTIAGAGKVSRSSNLWVFFHLIIFSSLRHGRPGRRLPASAPCHVL